MKCLRWNSAAIVLACCANSTSGDQFVPLDMSGFRNANRRSASYPLGQQVLGGVPFQLGTDADDYCWNANRPVTPIDDVRVLEFPINQFGVRAVHTLMNTIWGDPGPESSLLIEFVGSGGFVQSIPLVGNVHIRDYNQFCYTNRTDWSGTEQVAGSGGHRMDKQHFVLDPAFHTQTLLFLRLTDTGCGGQGSHCQCVMENCPSGGGCQRVFLSGVTVRICTGDLNADGVTDVSDLSTLLSGFGGPGTAAEGDINSDGNVDIQDLALLLAHFGAICD